MMIDDQIRREAESMRIFAEDEESFHFGWWREWRKACLFDGWVAPAEFKARKRETEV